VKKYLVMSFVLALATLDPLAGHAAPAAQATGCRGNGCVTAACVLTPAGTLNAQTALWIMAGAATSYPNGVATPSATKVSCEAIHTGLYNQWVYGAFLPGAASVGPGLVVATIGSVPDVCAYGEAIFSDSSHPTAGGC
jgi:hypothetical protein